MRTFEQVRALYGTDEQMARELFAQLQIARDLLVLERSLRRRAEATLEEQLQCFRKSKRNTNE